MFTLSKDNKLIETANLVSRAALQGKSPWIEVEGLLDVFLIFQLKFSNFIMEQVLHLFWDRFGADQEQYQ